MAKSRKPILGRKPAFLAVAIAFAAMAAAGQFLFSQATGPEISATASATGPQRPTFEVAAVKLNHSGTRNGGLHWGSDRVTATLPLKMLIAIAYQLKDFQVTGGPGWIGSDPYDIDAKIGDAAQKLPPKERLEQSRLMLQSLLADRFKLVLSRQSKTVSVYKLVVAKGGPKLHAAASDKVSWSEGNGQLKAQMITTSDLAGILSDSLGRIVVDETKLSGRYDISLQWSPDDAAVPTAGSGGIPGPSPASGPPKAADGPGVSPSGFDRGTIFTAVQEQLGLKLETAKAPVETMVVEHIERPSEN